MKKSSQKPVSRRNSIILVLTGFVLISGCSQKNSQSVQQASQSISDSLGCSDLQSKIFDSFYTLIDQDRSLPSASELKAELDKKIDELAQKAVNQSKVTQIKALKLSMHDLIDLLLSESINNPKISWKEQIQKLIEYEMEDQSNAAVVESTKNVNNKVGEIKKISQSVSASCATPTASAPHNVNPEPGSNGNSSAVKPLLMAKGLNKVFATAYQSCRVLDLPEMDRGTSNVVGITREGSHADGIGGKRFITDLKAVVNTHYYIRGIASESSCRDIKSNPLIYDYGGSPAVTSTSINFFTDAGSGTNALGVDCSAYISSGIAASGLRYKPGLENKPIFIRQNSAKFIDAEVSGFSCFENVTVSKSSSIKPGDIVGVSGHVVAVDRVGVDPFGLTLLQNESQCLTLSYKNFDIVVSQSSPSKNGIGINKYAVRDYLEESGKMRTAFVEMGKQACLAYFENKNIKPKSSSWGFLRHKGTAECLAPRVQIEGESCTQKCFLSKNN